MKTHANLHQIIWFDVFISFPNSTSPPYVSNWHSGGGVNGLFIHWNRSIFVNVLSLSDETRFEKCHLYAACCFSTAKINIVMSAVHICISTALDDVPTKLLIWKFCLMFRKKIPTSHLALYKSAMVPAESFMLLVNSSTVNPCRALYTAILRMGWGIVRQFRFLSASQSHQWVLPDGRYQEFPLFYALIQQVVFHPNHKRTPWCCPKSSEGACQSNPGRSQRYFPASPLPALRQYCLPSFHL